MTGRQEPVLCPHCEEVTMPNRLADGALVCSCAAERALPFPLAPGPGGPTSDGTEEEPG